MSSSSSTAIEASATSASGLPPEDELGRADRDRVAGAQLGPLELAAVDLGAVGRIQVDDPVGGAFLADFRVAARDVRVFDLNVGVLRAAYHDPPFLDFMSFAVPRERRDLPLETEFLRRHRLGVRLLWL